jgi:hypothetical protein
MSDTASHLPWWSILFSMKCAIKIQFHIGVLIIVETIDKIVYFTSEICTVIHWQTVMENRTYHGFSDDSELKLLRHIAEHCPSQTKSHFFLILPFQDLIPPVQLTWCHAILLSGSGNYDAYCQRKRFFHFTSWLTLQIWVLATLQYLQPSSRGRMDDPKKKTSGGTHRHTKGLNCNFQLNIRPLHLCRVHYGDFHCQHWLYKSHSN